MAGLSCLFVLVFLQIGAAQPQRTYSRTEPPSLPNAEQKNFRAWHVGGPFCCVNSTLHLCPDEHAGYSCHILYCNIQSFLLLDLSCVSDAMSSLYSECIKNSRHGIQLFARSSSISARYPSNLTEPFQKSWGVHTFNFQQHALIFVFSVCKDRFRLRPGTAPTLQGCLFL